jgi:hypothetical protein
MNAKATIIPLFIVHRSPFGVSQLADFFNSLYRMHGGREPKGMARKERSGHEIMAGG